MSQFKCSDVFHIRKCAHRGSPFYKRAVCMFIRSIAIGNTENYIEANSQKSVKK